MSPGHALPTGMANLEKSETMPEIQMPSMASLDPNFLGNAGGGEHAYYTSLSLPLNMLMKVLLLMTWCKYIVEFNIVSTCAASTSEHPYSGAMITPKTTSTVGKCSQSRLNHGGPSMLKTIPGKTINMTYLNLVLEKSSG
jgi:hypothetical protein